MNSILRCTAAAALAAAALHAGAQALPPDTPLVEDRGTRVTAADFEGYMLRIPEAERGAFRASKDRVAGVVDALFVTRTLARRAREQGLDKSPEVQARLAQLQEGLLADLYMAKVEKDMNMPNFEARARELYKADPKPYQRPEQVAVQHILIGLNERTRDIARARAEEVYAKVKEGKEDFMTLAKRFSDDPDVRRNSGELGWKAPSQLDPAFAEAVAKMTRHEEIAGPVETKFGFHIIRFLGRKPASVVPYEEARNTLIAQERQKLVSEKRQAIVDEIRTSTTVVTHPGSVDALKSNFDLSKPVKTVPGVEKK